MEGGEHLLKCGNARNVMICKKNQHYVNIFNGK
jgi:hypothetical protein